MHVPMSFVLKKLSISTCQCHIQCLCLMSLIHRLYFVENKLDIIGVFFYKLIEDVINFHLPTWTRQAKMNHPINYNLTKNF
jgi:hypothetical protein